MASVLGSKHEYQLLPGSNKKQKTVPVPVARPQKVLVLSKVPVVWQVIKIVPKKPTEPM